MPKTSLTGSLAVLIGATGSLLTALVAMDAVKARARRINRRSRDSMHSIVRLALLLWLPATVLAADDSRVTRLEQDVRTLQRDVQVLQRQLDSLRLQATRPDTGGGIQPPVARIAGNPDWVDAARWKRLHTGMSDLEVIATLGPPTSTRDADGAHQLLYAMEIGPASFLAGSVTLRGGSVVDVRIPTLR